MKKKKIKLLLIIFILLFVVVTTIFVAKHIMHNNYNNVEENWIIKISPNYLNRPANTVYLYKDSYIITNCFTINNSQNIVHKRGTLTSKVDENLIKKIKKEAIKELEWGRNELIFSITLKSGEKLTLTDNTESINKIINMINYDGIIWYAQD